MTILEFEVASVDMPSSPLSSEGMRFTATATVVSELGLDDVRAMALALRKYAGPGSAERAMAEKALDAIGDARVITAERVVSRRALMLDEIPARLAEFELRRTIGAVVEDLQAPWIAALHSAGAESP